MYSVGYRAISLLCAGRGVRARGVEWREWRIRVVANGSSSARRRCRAARADVTAR